ncbi:putative chemotaxis transducer [Pseudomonas aeruginosa 39016]|nr:putative chemotaxis transducer [Pseudomonas aeruginosa 39016]
MDRPHRGTPRRAGSLATGAGGGRRRLQQARRGGRQGRLLPQAGEGPEQPGGYRRPRLARRLADARGAGPGRPHPAHRGRLPGHLRPAQGLLQRDRAEPVADARADSRGRRHHQHRRQRDRQRQRRTVGAHRAAGVEPGGNRLEHGRTDQHGEAQRRECPPGQLAGGQCLGSGDPGRHRGAEGGQHHVLDQRVGAQDRRHHRGD